MNSIKHYFSLIKFSHTVFALPFALIGFFLALHGTEHTFSIRLFILIVLCMVFARSAAMSFNRITDQHIDKKNERTAQREIPSGKISARAAIIFMALHSSLFIFTTYFINPLCFYLSPVALFVILIYSVTKRFTYLCHYILGLGLSLAPIGAYISITGEFSIVPIIFSLVVLTWSGGFDILYALQDEEFDIQEKLHSIPAQFGRKKAMQISNVTHIITALLVIAAGVVGDFSFLYWGGALAFIGLLILQHSLVKPHDISKVNLAFGTTNGVASIVFACFVIADILIL